MVIQSTIFIFLLRVFCRSATTFGLGFFIAGAHAIWGIPRRCECGARFEALSLGGSFRGCMRIARAMIVGCVKSLMYLSSIHSRAVQVGSFLEEVVELRRRGVKEESRGLLREGEQSFGRSGECEILVRKERTVNSRRRAGKEDSRQR